MTLTPAANAALGSFPFTLIGRAKYQMRDVAATSAPAPLVVSLPFELKAEPLPLKLLPGGKAVLKVTATRKGGYAGPIAVEVRNLPANVTATKGTIAMGQTTVGRGDHGRRHAGGRGQGRRQRAGHGDRRRQPDRGDGELHGERREEVTGHPASTGGYNVCVGPSPCPREKDVP